MAASSEEEGQIDEEFWAKEDEADERKQLIWDNARPCSWSTQSARPRTGCRRVGDVYWPDAGVSAAAVPESTMSPPKKKKKKKTAAEPDAQMKRPADSEPARKEKKEELKLLEQEETRHEAEAKALRERFAAA